MAKKFTLDVLDLDNPLTVEHGSKGYTYGTLQTIRLDHPRTIRVGRQTSTNYPDIPLNSQLVSREQGVFEVKGSTPEGTPRVEYRDTGTNKPDVEFSGPSAMQRATMVKTKTSVPFFPGESFIYKGRNGNGQYEIVFGEHEDTE